MGAILGFFILVGVILLASYLLSRTNFSGPPRSILRNHYYYEDKSEAGSFHISKEDELYRAAKRSMKLNLMQMNAMREMEKVAKRHSTNYYDDFY